MNLLAQLLDLWFNPTVEEQAIDRAHRIGQTKPVHVTRIIIAGAHPPWLSCQSGSVRLVQNHLPFTGHLKVAGVCSSARFVTWRVLTSHAVHSGSSSTFAAAAAVATPVLPLL